MDDVRVRTNFGAMVTLFSLALIATLTMSEFLDYRKVHLKTSLVVDKSRGEKLNIGVNITFPRVPCYREYAAGERECAWMGLMRDVCVCPAAVISMDIMDISGEYHTDIHHDITRTRIDAAGKEIIEQGMAKKGE